MITLDKLLKYLPKKVYATAHDGVVVMRIRSEFGLSWRVSGGVLAVTVDDQQYAYSLANETLGGLYNKLLDDGIDVVYLNEDYLGRGALSLIEGEGNQDQSNGDHLIAHENLLWSLYGAYAGELSGAKLQSLEALKQMVMTNAEGFWLDVWGGLYGIPRLAEESDEAFALRIPKEAFRLRVNPRAIELAILDLTGKHVRILEPWQRIARWDEAILDSEDRMYDGEFIGYHIIQPESQEWVDWSTIMPIVHRNRPTGVLSLPPAIRLSFTVDATDHAATQFGIYRLRGALARYEDKLLLDFSYFGDKPIPNLPADHFREFVNYSHSVYDDEQYECLVFSMRDTRFFVFAAVYAYQTWNSSGTWDTSDNWTDVSYIEPAAHTQSS